MNPFGTFLDGLSLRTLDSNLSKILRGENMIVASADLI